LFKKLSAEPPGFEFMPAANILLVEDESITRANIADVLRSDGYAVDEAGDGAQAVELFAKRQFDLIVTDFVMPRMDGLRLISRVHSTSPHTPVILVTAYLSTIPGKAILQKTAEIIGKPVEPDVLLGTIKNLLSHRFSQ
jgi:CheY-like chemotaxis protein